MFDAGMHHRVQRCELLQPLINTCLFYSQCWAFCFTSHLGTLDGQKPWKSRGQPSFYMPNKTRDLGPWCPWLSMFFLTQWTTYITNIVCTLTDFNAAACCRVSICISWARVGQPAQVPVRHQCSMSSRPAGTGKWWILIGSRTLQDGKERIDSDC